MDQCFDKRKLWFKAIAILVVCLFLSNDIARAIGPQAPRTNVQNLNPALRTKPMIGITEQDGILVFDDLKKDGSVDFFRENFIFMYLSRLIGDVFESTEEKYLNEELFKDFIRKDMAHTRITTERFDIDNLKMKDGTVCLPYKSTKEGDTRKPFLRYYSPEHSPPAVQDKKSFPIGNVRVVCEVGGIVGSREEASSSSLRGSETTTTTGTTVEVRLPLEDVAPVDKGDKGENLEEERAPPRFLIETDLRINRDDFRKRLESIINNFFDDEDIQEVIEEAILRKGIDPGKITKIIVQRPKKLNPEDKFPRIDEERSALVINISEVSGISRELSQAVITFLSPKPFTADFIKTKFTDLVPEGELKRALQIACWEDFNPDEYLEGRSVEIKLSNPVTYNGVVYDSVKIKGVVFKRVLQPRLKSFIAKRPGEETHDIRIPDVNEEARVIYHKQLNPEGGLEGRIARNEIDMMEKSLERGLTLDVPIGAGIYRDLKMQDENLGFVISLIPDKKMENIPDMIEKAKVSSGSRGSRKEDRLFTERIELVRLREKIEEIFYQQGKRLREAHDEGMYLAFPHWGNFYVINGKYYHKDFSESQDIAEISENEPERVAAFRFLDICIAIQHFDQLPFYEERGLTKFWRETVCLRLELPFLMGYFHDRPEFFDAEAAKDLIKLINTRWRLVFEEDNKPVSEYGLALVDRLRDIVDGKEGQGGTPKWTVGYPYAEKDTPVGRVVWRMMKTGDLPHEDRLQKAGLWKFNFMEVSKDKADVTYDLKKGSVYMEIPANPFGGDVRWYIQEKLKGILKELEEPEEKRLSPSEDSLQTPPSSSPKPRGSSPSGNKGGVIAGKRILSLTALGAIILGVTIPIIRRYGLPFWGYLAIGGVWVLYFGLIALLLWKDVLRQNAYWQGWGQDRKKAEIGPEMHEYRVNYYFKALLAIIRHGEKQGTNQVSMSKPSKVFRGEAMLMTMPLARMLRNFVQSAGFFNPEAKNIPLKIRRGKVKIKDLEEYICEVVLSLKGREEFKKLVFQVESLLEDTRAKIPGREERDVGEMGFAAQAKIIQEALVSGKLNILYVCARNISRSYIMEMATRDFLEEKGLTDRVTVSSRSTRKIGKRGYPDLIWDALAKAFIRLLMFINRIRQKTIPTFKPQQVSREDIERASLIIVDSELRKKKIFSMVPEAEAKTFLFTELLPEDNRSFGKSLQDRTFVNVEYIPKVLRETLFPLIEAQLSQEETEQKRAEGDEEKKILIVYHSGSGGTKNICEAFKEELSGRYQVDMIEANTKFDGDLSRYALVLFGFPTFKLAPSKSIQEFIDRLPMPPGPVKAFAFCTKSTVSADTLRKFADMLFKKNIILGASAEFRAPGTDVVLDFPEKLLRFLHKIFDYAFGYSKNTRKKIKRSVRAIDKLIRAPFVKLKMPRKKITALLWNLAQKKVFDKTPINTSPLEVISSRCSKCGQCAVKFCPRKAWKLIEGGVPEWIEESCDRCMSCVHRCPKKAIIYDEEMKDKPRLDSKFHKWAKEKYLTDTGKKHKSKKPYLVPMLVMVAIASFIIVLYNVAKRVADISIERNRGRIEALEGLDMSKPYTFRNEKEMLSWLAGVPRKLELGMIYDISEDGTYTVYIVALGDSHSVNVPRYKRAIHSHPKGVGPHDQIPSLADLILALDEHENIIVLAEGRVVKLTRSEEAPLTPFAKILKEADDKVLDFMEEKGIHDSRLRNELLEEVLNRIIFDKMSSWDVFSYGDGTKEVTYYNPNAWGYMVRLFGFSIAGFERGDYSSFWDYDKDLLRDLEKFKGRGDELYEEFREKAGSIIRDKYDRKYGPFTGTTLKQGTGEDSPRLDKKFHERAWKERLDKFETRGSRAIPNGSPLGVFRALLEED
ncbi:MAG: hypothetical protein HQ594_01360, partial [Candidatus Omnitrophica bacterium]|nr:hypothetical protein [Candidatus Omnitrophota bacterium]